MIGYIKGTVLFKDDEHAVLEAGGVGFEVSLSGRASDALPPEGEVGELYIHTLVREDDISLFGFATRDERHIFLSLMTVNGVGPRNAMSVVSQLQDEEIIQALASANPIPFTKVKGIGKKTAERIVLDLKNKVGKIFFGSPVARSSAAVKLAGNLLEVESALLALGYKRPEILAAIDPLRTRKDAPVEDLLREALRRMTR